MKVLFLIISLMFISGVQASSDIYPFDTQSQQTQFHQLISELRCLVCQNQNILDSHAPLAADLRQEVYERVKVGEDSSDIISFLTDRYGDFVLYRPPVNASTYLLWFGPYIFLLLGFGILFKVITNARRSD